MTAAAGAGRTAAAWRRRAALLGVRHQVVKIHGQQRSGTNFVHRLLKVNAPRVLAPWPDEGGWKHGPYEPHRRWKYLVVVRHPLAWVESLWDWEVKHGRSDAPTLSAYLRAPTLDPRLSGVWRTTDPWRLWVVSYSTWCDSPLTSAVVRYDDLVTNLQGALASMLNDLRVMPEGGLRDVVDRADVWRTQVQRRPLDRQRALHGWRDAVDERDLDVARQTIPEELLVRLGYSF